MKNNLRQFIAQTEGTKRAVKLEWRERAIELGTYGIGRLVEVTEDTGSVDTGAYRASHVIEQDGAPIYEHSERPDPNQIIPSRGAPFISPPRIRDVQVQLKRVMQLASFAFVNRRFYAHKLEWGTAGMAARAIYEQASDAVDSLAASLARDGHWRVKVPGQKGGVRA